MFRFIARRQRRALSSLVIRFIYTTMHSERRFSPFFFKGKDLSVAQKSVIIIGAGDAGEKMLREIFDNPKVDYRVVGFLDDDCAKWGCSLHGLKVFGGVDLLPKIFQQRQIDEVLIAIPCASGVQMRRIIEICKHCKARYRTLPEIGAIIDGKVHRLRQT